VDSLRAIALQDLDASETVQLFAEIVRNSGSLDQPVTAAFLNLRNYVAAMQSDALVDAFCAIDYVFPDGIAMQLGRQLLRLRPFRRVSGTDTVPSMLRDVAPLGCRLFLLGGTPEHSAATAARLPQLFPGVTLVGYHHGYFDASAEQQLISRINASECDLLLVGMGTPLQELWLQRNRALVRARLVICVGGLFHYWSRDLIRAPRALAHLGLEWLWIFVQQPFRWPVYTIGAVRYLVRVLNIASTKSR
jgi:N-acetylglucosaminyldiphosphoundecaprenol N-acetyl-beta-D-mannosaminyltransferase